MKKLEVVTPTPKHASRYVWVHDEDGTVAELRNDARGLAYAKQFAAAPDLLEFVKGLIFVSQNWPYKDISPLDENSPLMDEARSIIAKAETL